MEVKYYDNTLKKDNHRENEIIGSSKQNLGNYDELFNTGIDYNEERLIADNFTLKKEYYSIKRELLTIEEKIKENSDKIGKPLIIEGIEYSFKVSDAIGRTENIYLYHKRLEKNSGIELDIHDFISKDNEKIKEEAYCCDMSQSDFSQLLIDYIEEKEILKI